MTQETLKRGNEINEEVRQLRGLRLRFDNKEYINSFQIRKFGDMESEFNIEEVPEFVNFIDSVVKRIDISIDSLENEFKAL